MRLEAITSRLSELANVRLAMLDRWIVTGSMPEGVSALPMSNYMSIGCDAKAAALWAILARRVPWAFRLRLLNKLWYIICGTPEYALHTYRDLAERMTITCDGKPIELPRGIEGVMVLNTPSYGGGSDLWDEARAAPLAARTKHFQTPPARPCSMSDGLLEVVGVTDVLHLALALGGLSNGVRICQGETVQIRASGSGSKHTARAPHGTPHGAPHGAAQHGPSRRTHACFCAWCHSPLTYFLLRALLLVCCAVPLQIDGEPFNLDEGPDGAEPFDVAIERTGQAFLLARDTARGGGTNAYVAIEQQLAARELGTQQRDDLLRALGSD